MKYLVGIIAYECAVLAKDIGKTIKTKYSKKIATENLITSLKEDLEDEKKVSKHIKWEYREIDADKIPMRK